jgi:hypothetical protein
MDPAVVAALITGSVSLLVAVFSVTFTAYTQRKTAKDNRARDEELARLNASLTQQRDEDIALRDYTYEARKRLYKEVNPLFFRLREFCEGSMGRITRIVSEDIKIVSEDDTVRTDYLVRTTTQRLVRPLVMAQEIQRHMTAVDLSVDPAIKVQYIVSRELLGILHEGDTIAAAHPAISYHTPGEPRPPGEARQHLTFGQLQRLVDVFTAQEEDGTRRPLKLIELEDRKSEERIADVLDQMKTLFTSASASSTAVLWRLLIAQASLMHVLIDLVDRGSATVNGVLPVNIRDFKWKPEGGPSFESQVGAVDAFLRERLSRSGLHLAPASRFPL